MTKRLKDKVAVVLGASAKGGSGYAIAKAFAEEGCKVVVAARREAPLKAFAEEIGGVAVVCDTTKEDEIAALADAARNAFGKVDIAVNAAGGPKRGSIADVTRADLQDTLDLNYIPHVFFVKYMAEAIDTDGSIIIISSMSATCQTDGAVFAYSCAKAAASCLVQCAAIEYGSRNIKVNALLPGPIDSAASQGLFSHPEIAAAFAKEIPLGRVARPEDLADAAVWLAGPSFVTGLNLQVNGGNFLYRFPTPNELPGGRDAYKHRPLSQAD